MDTSSLAGLIVALLLLAAVVGICIVSPELCVSLAEALSESGKWAAIETPDGIRVGRIVWSTESTARIDLVCNSHEWRCPSLKVERSSITVLSPDQQAMADLIPSWYYSRVALRKRTEIELQDTLSSFMQNFPVYTLDIYDCSQSAAYMEWALENEGFDARIATGPAPFDPTGYHAWVIVFTATGPVAIEPTNFFPGLSATWQEIKREIWRLITGHVPGMISRETSSPIAAAYYSGYDVLYYDIYGTILPYHDSKRWLEEWYWGWSSE